MTVYSTTISTSPSDFNGNTTTSFVSERINDTGANFVSSEDFDNGGMQVIDKSGDRKSVYSADDLDPSDIVNVGGIPMTVAQAKSAGVNVSVDAAAASREVAPQTPQDPAEPAVDTQRHDDGHATDAEIVAMDNVVSAVEMHTGMDQDAAIELGKDILLGQIPEGDAVWTGLQNKGISSNAAVASVNQVVQIGQAAAQRELGVADYN